MVTKLERKSDLYRKLPSVDEFIRSSEISGLVAREGLTAVTQATRAVLERLRQRIRDGQVEPRDLDAERLAVAVAAELRRALAPSLQLVINATGVILHTNLGRAPLALSAIEHVRAVAAGYSNLEFALADGQRGKRDVHVSRLFQQLLRDESQGGAVVPEVATIVVNNNAAAVWLALNTLAAGGEVIVSRGELVEIGGSFRIPDVMTQSNAILREVGTTNRTRIADYERAINDKTRLLLRVHRSNFEITGFTEQPAIEELAALARARGIPLVEDLGSGALFDLASVGIRGESGVLDSLRLGVDVVTYSGDKLLGGPQAGMLSGRPELIARMRSNPLFRALRVDKLTYAALEATLLAYVRRDYNAIPALRAMRLSKEAIRERALRVVEQIGSRTALSAEIVDGESVIGGGAAPSSALPTALLAVSCAGMNADEMLARLRAAKPPIVARVENEQVLLDLRTVFPEQDELLAAALVEIAKTAPSEPQR